MKTAKQTEGMEPKLKEEFANNQRKIMHSHIDERLLKKKGQLIKSIRHDDLGLFWRTWSRCVEQGILRYVGGKVHLQEDMMGRGEVRIFEPQPFNKKVENDDEMFSHIRNKTSRAAHDALCQARRCEQFAHRLEIMQLKGEKLAHWKLNKEAIANKSKKCDNKETWQNVSRILLNRKQESQYKKPAMIPILKKHAGLFSGGV